MISIKKSQISVITRKIYMLLSIMCLLSLLGCSTAKTNNNSAEWKELPHKDQQTYLENDGDKQEENINQALENYINSN